MFVLPDRRMRLGVKIAKFIAFAAVDFLVPDLYSKPLAFLWNFYRTFLCTDPQTLLELYAEAERVTPERRAEVVNVLMEEMSSLLPEGKIAESDLRGICERLLDALRAAAEAEKRGEPAAEQLRHTLNAQFFAGKERVHALIVTGSQALVGRLRVSTVLGQAPRGQLGRTADIRELPTLPDYEVLTLIGRGGFSEVYKAIHKPTGELRAIKIGELVEPERFDREWKICSALKSPHLLKYYERGEFNEGGRRKFWLASEYLGEQTLADIMRNPEFRSNPLAALLIGYQILLGLRDMHRAGIVHRDLKPANVMFDSEQKVKLIDFGLAKPLQRVDMMSTQSVGGMRGTPFYMSPEQMRGSKEISPASDIFSFGILVFEMCSGQNPNEAESLADVIIKVCTRTPDVTHPSVPAELQDILRRCVQLDPKQRYNSAKDLLIDWRKVAVAARSRIIFERDRQSWLVILDKDLLVTYLDQCLRDRRNPDSREFNRLLRGQNIRPVAESRLQQVFPPLLEAMQVVHGTKAKIVIAKQGLAKSAVGATTQQIQEHLDGIKRLEQELNLRIEELRTRTRQLLRYECQSWEEWKQEEAARLAHERERAEAEARRKQVKKEELARWQNKLTQMLPVVVAPLVIFLVLLGLIWTILPERPAASLRGHDPGGMSVPSSPDGRQVLTGSDDKTARLWDTASITELKRFKGHSDWVPSVPSSPDGRDVRTGSDDKTARLWDIASITELKRFKGHSDWVQSVVFSPDGRYVLTGSGDKTARLWDTDSGTELKRFEGHSDWVQSVAFSPDGRQVLTGSGDNTARLWDAASGTELKRFTGHSDWVQSVAFSPDGRYVLTGSDDNTARLWDTASGTELKRFKGHSNWVRSVAFSPDGRHVLTGSGDRTARLWDTVSGTELKRFEGHSDWVRSVAFSPDGRYVLTGSDDKTARLWDTASGTELKRFKGHSDWVSSVAFSPDGRYVLTGSDDKTARLWGAP